MLQKDDIGYLLRRLKSGRITADELKALKRFFDNKSQTDRYFQESYDSLPEGYPIWKNSDKESVWETISHRINNRQNNFRKTINKLKWRAAAVLILFIGSVVFFTQYNKTDDIIVENTTGEPLELYLPDSSMVFLNSGSLIRYDKVFKDNRELSLKGEAFFKVTRDTSHPFSVRTAKITTRVLGTSFTIKTTDSLTKVVVNTGLVQVYNAVESHKLQPDDMIEFDQYSGMFRENKTKAPFHNLWTRERITFRHISLGKLSEAFRLLYNKHVVFEDESLKDKKLHSFFILREESLQNLVERINYINEVELKITANDIIVQPKH